MADTSSVAIPADELDGFLGRGGTGVISFSTSIDDPPYSLPVSYGYDGASGQFYFRLADGSGEKWDAMAAGDHVSFVTYGQAEGEWWSVVATGTLEAVADDAVDPVVSEAMRRVQIPIVDVYDAPPRALTFRFFRLDPGEVTGRREVHAED